MSVIGIVSMKGGVGKTSTTANLAAAIASKLGPGRVSVVDLDPQNALHWHFGLDTSDLSGVCEQSLEDMNWRDIAEPTQFDVACLRYGPGNEADREAFETLLADEPNWLGHQIERAGLGDNAVVLIDTPPGPSVYLKQVFACADIILIVLLADAGSYATIPAMESWLDDISDLRPDLGNMYILNQVDTSEPLSRDVVDLLRQHLGRRLAPIGIHSDEAVSEALAFQQPVLAYDPHGQASHDIARLSTWLIDTLNQ
ncbi:cellulose biosynthesis protein BcsQ [Noviherbaspirillum saxi]|uniref:Cellulose synthase operon protein YhjQ n=1 Tax=Noviherbaspirillum saxi TaxID=2320863 RepID=A0A3A3FZB2_9BURK|nr:cellulose biosynthesis protein BcsQ [Noviherbaspirillum saxi]RJF92429.1 cellulose synthase operon protein YhjQ [Noviherbaspirillum saxi]